MIVGVKEGRQAFGGKSADRFADPIPDRRGMEVAREPNSQRLMLRDRGHGSRMKESTIPDEVEKSTGTGSSGELGLWNPERDPREAPVSVPGERAGSRYYLGKGRGVEGIHGEKVERNGPGGRLPSSEEGASSPFWKLFRSRVSVGDEDFQGRTFLLRVDPCRVPCERPENSKGRGGEIAIDPRASGRCHFFCGLHDVVTLIGERGIVNSP